MKFILMLMVVLAPYGYTQSLHDRKIKEEMLSRTDTLLLKIEEGQNALEREDVSLACKKINQIFNILPNHLISIGSRMNMFHTQVIKMENQTKSFLIYIHQQSNTCKMGEPGEYLNITEVHKRFHSAYKMLEKQRADIKKMDTDFENVYNYYYEFS
jgi:hypothetical protein